MLAEDQIYEKKLSISYWLVTHKILLKNILIVFLIFINVSLISFDLYLLIDNLVISNKNYQAELNSLINPNSDYAAFRQIKQPSALQTGNIRTLANAGNFDILADVKNSNNSWGATFSYQFKIGDKLTDLREEFILPGQSKTIFNMSVAGGNAVSDIIISNVKWTKALDFQSFSAQRINFNISNIKFIPSSQLGVGEKISINRATFDVLNSSAYNYANVNFVVYLIANGAVAAVGQVSSGAFSSGKTLNLELNFFQRLPNIDSVQVVPAVNILNPDVFLKS